MPAALLLLLLTTAPSKASEPALGPGVFVLVSMLATAYVAHYNAPTFYNELAPPEGGGAPAHPATRNLSTLARNPPTPSPSPSPSSSRHPPITLPRPRPSTTVHAACCNRMPSRAPLSLPAAGSKLPRFNKVVAGGFALAALLSAAIMSGGFLTFGAATQGLLLNNYAS